MRMWKTQACFALINPELQLFIPLALAHLPAQCVACNRLCANHAKSRMLLAPPFNGNRGTFLPFQQRPSPFFPRDSLQWKTCPWAGVADRKWPPDFLVYRCTRARPAENKINGKCHDKNTERPGEYGISDTC